jgi:hypothetical protein
LLVSSVTQTGAGTATWTFPVPMAVAGGPNPELEVLSDVAGWTVPTSLVAAGNTLLWAAPVSGTLIAWRILTTPAYAKAASGTPITAPQSGAVT